MFNFAKHKFIFIYMVGLKSEVASFLDQIRTREKLSYVSMA